MRIVAVVGSNRRGNTYAMVEAACHALRDFEVELLHVKGMLGESCDGCLQCDESGDCHVDDPMRKAVADIAKADGLVLGTPARWALLSGELKVFLDRLNPLAVKGSLAGKKALLLVVGQCEGDDAWSIKSALESLKSFCRSAGIEVVADVQAQGCLNADDVIARHPAILVDCRTAAQLLADALLKERKHRGRSSKG